MAILTPQTQSIIEGPGGSNRTGTQISPMIVLRVGPNPVGAVQSMTINETRNVQAIDEVGTDGHIDSAPTKSTDISGSCRRVRYDRLRISEAFSRGFVHVKSQRIPFDIDIYDKWNGDNENMIVTTIKNVWITGINYTYSADNWIVIDDMNWMAEDISSSLGGDGVRVAATGGARGLILQTDTAGIEAQTDRGQRRGALDAADLINAAFSNF